MARKKSAGRQSQIRITQIRSGLGKPEVQRATLRALGLRRHQQTVVQQDSPAIRGMIFRVKHLLRVEEIPGGTA